MKNLIMNNRTGEEMDYEAAVMLMDDDIREELHREIAPCTDEEFLNEYAERHFEKYGEEFTI